MNSLPTVSSEEFSVVQATNATTDDGDSSFLSTPIVYAIITGSMFCAVVLLGLVNAAIKNKTCNQPKDEEMGEEPTERWVSPKAQPGDIPKRQKGASGKRSSGRKMKLKAAART